ncbi:MAG: hypothetical protein PWP15_1212 [Methanothermococcus sp.]|uniref:COG1361 S-layer family protein n=1 Tax=Methanothermococcus sp. TaxID=2614238 RepID=UPI00258F6E14|nr:hypothetical protein [Methanothermococcus sp.]MDK2790705.1 hypothetical protein [Methanothermococcus sp.]MDK2987535.1 hypothetical protein [Methanothermococcus sp.]
MKKPLILFILFLSLILINSINAIEFTSFDYKNEYLEPGKIYDLWVVITPEKEINNTIMGIYPYGAGKEYIQIIEGKDYEGQLFPSEKGVGHFIIQIKDNAPSKDYKIVAYCNYTEDGKQYSENRIFKIPVRGKPILIIENPPVINEGMNKVYLKVKNKGTGIAQDIKIEFNEGNNIYALSSGYINYLKPGETRTIEIGAYADNGIAKLPYIITYSNPYNNLQLTDKTETEQGNTNTITYNYKNQKTVEETGNLIFKVIPGNAIDLNVKDYSYPVGEVNNFTLYIKNNYKDANFIITIGEYYLGNNQKTVFIKHGKTKNITFKIKINGIGVKEIPIKIIFDGNEINKNISINVIGKIDLVLTGVNVEGITEKTITGDLSNIGTSKAKSVLISVKKTNDVMPLRPYENYFIGTLNPDDYGSFELHAGVNGTDSIPIIIEYRDENNNLIKIEKNISIKNVNINFDQSQRNNSSYMPLIIAVLFVIGVLFLLYRGFFKKKEDIKGV